MGDPNMSAEECAYWEGRYEGNEMAKNRIRTLEEENTRLRDALEGMYNVVCEALANPAEDDTAVLVNICDIFEALNGNK